MCEVAGDVDATAVGQIIRRGDNFYAVTGVEHVRHVLPLGKS